MKKKKGLQKFTDIEKKVNDLLKKKQVTKDDIKKLNDKELEHFFDLVVDNINTLKGIKRDEFLEVVDLILPKYKKNELWGNNHIKITGTISNLIQEYNRLPNKTEIAKETGLSRTTIHKHLKEYANHPVYLEYIEQHKILSSALLTTVYKYATKGDMSAAKLYFKMLGYLDNGKAISNTFNQNNYIQINNTILNQDTIKNLNTDQLNAIESILNTVNPTKEVVEVGN